MTSKGKSAVAGSQEDGSECEGKIIKSLPAPGLVQVHCYVGENIPGVVNIKDRTCLRRHESSGLLRDSAGKRKRSSGLKDTSIVHSSDESDLDDEEGSRCQLNYFLAQSMRSKTSTKSLKDIDLSALKIADDGPLNYLQSNKLRTELYLKHAKLFEEMYFLLFEGANVLTYGFGSKKVLLEQFCDKWLKDEYRLIIYGFFPEITFRHILMQLKEALGAETADEESLYLAAEQLEYNLYLVIHSLDILLTTSPTKLKTLLIEVIAKGDGKVRLVASVDHVHSTLLWNSRDWHQLNLAWMSCPTFDAYTVERGYGSNLNSNLTSAVGLTLSSIEHVYESLNPNAQKIFILVLNYFLLNANSHVAVKSKIPAGDSTESSTESSDESEDELRATSSTKKSNEGDGLPFSTLYRTCREEYLVNSEMTLKAQLTEFKDHNLIKFKKRSDGTQVINLVISSKIAQKFIDKIEESL